MKNRNKNYKKEISNVKGIDYVKKRKCKRKEKNDSLRTLERSDIATIEHEQDII